MFDPLFSVNDANIARLPIYQDVTARDLHIFSPRYPEQMQSASFNFTCSIEMPAGFDFL